jgi:hypothetical protein
MSHRPHARASGRTRDGRMIQTLLFNVQPLEPSVYGGVAVVFALDF